MSPIIGKPECPYCHKGLETKPIYEKKCPHCGELILVQNEKLQTQEEAQVDDWLSRLEIFDIRRKDFDNHKKALRREFGSNPSVRDTIWRILNLIVMSDDLVNRRHAYYEMANIAREEGKDARPFIENALKTQLIEYKDDGYSKVKILHSNDYWVCENCRDLAGMEFSIEDALLNMPVPRQCVSEEGCRCRYDLSDPFEVVEDRRTKSMVSQDSNDNGLSGYDEFKGSKVVDSLFIGLQSSLRGLFQIYEFIRNAFYAGIIGAILAVIAIRPKNTDPMWFFILAISAVFGTVIGFIGGIVAYYLNKKSITKTYTPWVGYLLSSITSFATILIIYFT